MGATVETQSGPVRGVEENGLLEFRGIPYAAPPTGARRFKAPEPVEPWTQERDASGYGPSAPQPPMVIDFLPGMDVGPQGEDCLYLNVTTPAADAAGRPVLVWIHGGAFVIGSGSQDMYDPTRLVRDGDVVLVRINYRLGALGFLHASPLLGEGHAGAGNLGILDQVAALHWVRDNIARFGGDPDNVTIFGESAGGMSVGTLLGTPAARGLFQRAIPQSGAASNVADADAAAEAAALLLEKLASGDPERLLDATPAEMLAAQQAVSAEYQLRGSLLPFRPVVDGTVLSKPPLAAIADGLAADVPVLVGATRDEWNLFGLMDPSLGQLDDAGLVERLSKWVGTEGARRVVDGYREAREGHAPTDPRSLFLAIESDRFFRIPGIRLAEAQLAHQRGTYQYLFTWESPLLGGLGACHGIDVPFVFGMVDSPGADKFIGSGDGVRTLADVATAAWLAFARSGQPGHPDADAWPAYELSARATMLLGPDIAVEHDPLSAQREVWDGLL